MPVESKAGGDVVWEAKIRIKGLLPIPSGYWYSDFDDFGNSRSYGFQRRHFGHDLMVGTGTPVVSIEAALSKQWAGISMAAGVSDTEL